MRLISTNYVTSKKLTTSRRLPSPSVTLSPTALSLPTAVAGVRLPPVQSLGVNHSVNFLGRGVVHVLVAGLSPGQIVPRLPAPHAMIYATCVRDPRMSTVTL